MRKLLIIIFISLFNAFLFADTPIFNDIPGSYVIYHDTRFKDDVYLGLAYLGENKLLARSFETKDDNELQVIIQLTINTDGEIDLGKNLSIRKGDLKSSQAASRVIPMILNWATTWYKERKT